MRLSITNTGVTLIVRNVRKLLPKGKDAANVDTAKVRAAVIDAVKSMSNDTLEDMVEFFMSVTL